MAPELETSVRSTRQHQETGQRVGSRDAHPVGTRSHLPRISFKLGGLTSRKELAWRMQGGALKGSNTQVVLTATSSSQSLSKESICRVGGDLTSLGNSRLLWPSESHAPRGLGFIHVPSSELCISNLPSALDFLVKKVRLVRAHNLLSANMAFADLNRVLWVSLFHQEFKSVKEITKNEFLPKSKTDFLSVVLSLGHMQKHFLPFRVVYL